MGSKFLKIGAGIVLITIIIALIGCYLGKGDAPISPFEKRCISLILLITIGVIAFGVLRLYNAVVFNSRVLIRNQKVLEQFQRDMHSFGGTMNRASNTFSENVSGLKVATDALLEFLKGLK